MSGALERWASVPGYGGDYEISSFGKVRSHKRRKPYLMALVPNSDGYLTVKLSDGHRVLTRYIVHRLVCAAFNGDPAPGQEVAHLDGTRTNNRATNLLPHPLILLVCAAICVAADIAICFAGA